MRGLHEVAGPLPASFHDVDLRRPAAVIRQHPERRPDAGADRDLRADFEIAVLLRERGLRGQDARDVGIVEQRGLQLRRRAACDDRQHAVADPERVEIERPQREPPVMRVHIDLLLAIVLGLTLELGAGAAPILRLRPGRAAGIMRQPCPVLERMLVEIIVEGAMQRDGSEIGSVDLVDATALLACSVMRGQQCQLLRRGLEMVLREARYDRYKTADQGQNFRIQRRIPKFMLDGRK